MKKLLALMLAVMLLMLTGCASTGKVVESTEAPAATDAPTEAPTEEPSAEPAETEETEATAEATATAEPYPLATITMKDGGVIKLNLFPGVAPNTVANFISLANSGFYDGLTFHRVIEGFMIQGGCPHGTGTGSPGYTIFGEFAANGFRNVLSHKRGVISMARSQMPNSAGSQFFIMHKEALYLDGQYAGFGKVIEGMDVVDAIATTATGANDKPVEDQVIESIRVETWGVEYEVVKN